LIWEKIKKKAMNKSCIVIGLQRSGTEYLENILKVNYGVTIRNHPIRGYFWKHTPDPTNLTFRSDICHMLIYKNPYSWIESIKRKCVDMWHRHKEYGIQNVSGLKNSEIIHSENRCRLNLKKLCLLYSVFFKNWLIYPPIDLPVIIDVQYENLIVKNGLEVPLINIEKTFNVTRKSSNIEDVKKVPQSDLFSEDNREQYLDMNNFDLSSGQIEIINENIPDIIFERLKYTRVQKGVKNEESKFDAD